MLGDMPCDVTFTRYCHYHAILFGVWHTTGGAGGEVTYCALVDRAILLQQCGQCKSGGGYQDYSLVHRRLDEVKQSLGVTLNPPRGRRVALRQGDRVVVLGDALMPCDLTL